MTQATEQGWFQPTHPHGVRRRGQKRLMLLDKFQPTHPHGVRRQHVHMVWEWLRFNPRTRTGCDSLLRGMTGMVFKFQPTHPHGVRRVFFNKLEHSVLFQPTHPHGVRRSYWVWSIPYPVSTHAPARVRRRAGKVGIKRTIVSTHAPHGCDMSSIVTIEAVDAPTHAPARVRRRCVMRAEIIHSFNPRTRTGATQKG